ncbi:MAG TPA: LuxR C-terminal-related transcriptional regulator [bacterium]|nr:LuxR C-terminal-related transcriptional regulator [bacterium]
MPRTGFRPSGVASPLPAAATPLVGRSRELQAIVQALRGGGRLLTLSGPPGVGKTRLALAVAAAVEGQFQSGVLFVNLAPVLDPAFFEHTLIQRLALRRFAARPPLERLTRHLGNRHLLLVLDNFEQVIAAAPRVATLVASCPRLHVLVTSREALRLAGEREFPLSPLSPPDLRESSNLAAVKRSPAAALFVARTRAVSPGFILSRENAPVVAEICRRLDGLPLAIELAAARGKVLPPEAMLVRLAERLPLLVTGPRDLPERHQTLRAAIAWSEDLLGADERAVFRRLAVFPSGFTLEAAQAVAAADISTDALAVITGLVNKSLLRREPTTASEPRFGMLQTLREYAAERLTVSGEAEAMRDRHLEHFVGVAERARALFNSEQAPEWLALVEREYENFRAALAWAAERARPDEELRLASAICRFWAFRGNVGEGYRWVDAALARSAAAAPSLRAMLLHGAAALTQDDLQRRIALDREALALARRIDDRETAARCLVNLAITYLSVDAAQARPLLLECLAIAREINDQHRIGTAVQGFAILAQLDGDPARAACLHGAAEVILEKFELGYSPYSIADQTLLGRSIVAVLRDLGREAFGAAWADGRRMPQDLLIDYALGRVALPAAAMARAERSSGRGPLSARERQIADLVMQGFSNREIGRALAISERTVDAHIQHILNKLGFTSRAQIAAWVAVSQPSPRPPASAQ